MQLIHKPRSQSYMDLYNKSTVWPIIRGANWFFPTNPWTLCPVLRCNWVFSHLSAKLQPRDGGISECMVIQHIITKTSQVKLPWFATMQMNLTEDTCKWTSLKHFLHDGLCILQMRRVYTTFNPMDRSLGLLMQVLFQWSIAPPSTIILVDKLIHIRAMMHAAFRAFQGPVMRKRLPHRNSVTDMVHWCMQ